MTKTQAMKLVRGWNPNGEYVNCPLCEGPLHKTKYVPISDCLACRYAGCPDSKINKAYAVRDAVDLEIANQSLGFIEKAVIKAT